MADTALPLSPPLERLIRCLSGGMDVAFELFSPELTPLLAASEDRTLAALRQAVATAEDEAMRTALSVVLGTDARQRIETATLVIHLRPIRDELRTIGLLAAAMPTTGDASHAERHMEMAGEAIKQLLEAEVQSARADSARERQGARWVQLIGYLPGVAREAELFDVFLQALAIWHDCDTRVYVRDVGQRFVLAASLPGSRNEGPVQLPSELAERRGLDRISSIAELERLGWYGPPYQLTLIPLGPQNEATHVVAIRGILDARLEPNVLMGCRILEVCLDRALEREERRLEERFFWRVHEIGGASTVTLTTLMRNLIDDLARWVGAEHGAFHVGAPETPQAGATPLAAEAGAEANRFLVPLSLPGPAPVLEFSTSSAAPFTVRHLRLARAGAKVFTHWLLGLNQASQILERDRQARGGGPKSGPHAI